MWGQPAGGGGGVTREVVADGRWRSGAGLADQRWAWCASRFADRHSAHARLEVEVGLELLGGAEDQADD
eukprot:610826-Prymnesium_polylepis.1